jgi:hypothetical protein
MAKSSEARDKMVERVQTAAGAWPTFLEMPENPAPRDGMQLIFTPLRGGAQYDNAAYVEALYEMSHRGGVPVGRVGGEATIVGEIPK